VIIDKTKALELLDAAVAAEGEDKTVLVCNYFKEDGETPNCIVGHALSQIGVKLEDLRYNDEFGIEEDAARTLRRMNGMGVTAVRVEGVEITTEAMRIFDTAQSVQDGRTNGVHDRSWGSAVRHAHLVGTNPEGEQA